MIKLGWNFCLYRNYRNYIAFVGRFWDWTRNEKRSERLQTMHLIQKISYFASRALETTFSIQSSLNFHSISRTQQRATEKTLYKFSVMYINSSVAKWLIPKRKKREKNHSFNVTFSYFSHKRNSHRTHITFFNRKKIMQKNVS